ncbi:MAG: hypothetical protein E6Z12_02030 [Finegoldia magna]|nr:hypothetical protein [Finegoldia magna]
MSLYGDYCPYCHAEIEAEDLFEVCDCSGSESDELKQCPRCHKVFRTSLEPVMTLSIQSEEDYLEWLLKYNENNKKLLKSEDDEDWKKYLQNRIDEVKKDIEESRKNVEKNKKGEWEEDEI